MIYVNANAKMSSVLGSTRVGNFISSHFILLMALSMLMVYCLFRQLANWFLSEL